MNGMITLAGCAQAILDKIRNNVDFIGSVLLRLYLVPVFWVAGNNKWNPLDESSSLDPVIEWFGNPEWGLGLPVPALNSPFASADAGEALERLSRAKSILREHGDYGWLTEHGNFVVSNNGIEWAATYLIMLAALFFLGGGRYISVDYWIRRRFN